MHCRNLSRHYYSFKVIVIMANTFIINQYFQSHMVSREDNIVQSSHLRVLTESQHLVDDLGKNSSTDFKARFFQLSLYVSFKTYLENKQMTLI